MRSEIKQPPLRIATHPSEVSQAAPPMASNLDVAVSRLAAPTLHAPLTLHAPPAPFAPFQPPPAALTAPSGVPFSGQPATTSVLQAQTRLLEAQGRTRKLIEAHSSAGGAAPMAMPLAPIMQASLNGRPPAGSYHEQVDAARERYRNDVQARMFRRPF